LYQSYALGYGSPYSSLGYGYRYDAGQGCYRRSYGRTQTYASAGVGYGNVPQFVPYTPKDSAATVTVPGLPPRPRGAPTIQPKDVIPGSTGTKSPGYRRRGLITSDDDASGTQNGSRRFAVPDGAVGERPGMQQMVNRSPIGA